MTRILLVGLGRWGVNHLRNLHSMPLELYVAELDSHRLDPARQCGLAESRLTTDYRAFIDVVDAVVIVTPAQTHVPLCLECLHAGKDVFVEKPLAIRSAEARELAETAQRSGRLLQVGHILRFDPASQWLAQNIRSGAFGHVHIFRGIFSGFKRPRPDTGVVFADAVHLVDLLHYLLGRTPVKVSAVIQDFLGRGMEDASLLSLEFQSPRGPTWATIEADYFLPGKFREMTVVGSKMTAVCDFNASQYKIRTFGNHHTREGSGFKAVEGALHQVECLPEEPLLAELRAFVESVKTREAPRADGWAGYQSIRVLEAALESARTGRSVALE